LQPSSATRSPTGSRNARTGPAPTLRRCISTSAAGAYRAEGAHDIITTIAATAQPDGEITAHTLRHTFATRLVRGRTDLITVAELLGHARLETTRAYSRPTHDDRADALNLLDIDQ
jgi:site-specific recombinase XerD